jgi:hypothetical protein
MLKIGDRLDSYTLAAGEPWIMSVQMRSMIGNTVLNWSQRRLVLSFYDVDRTKLDQIDGVYSSDASGAFFAFIRDGRFSEGLFGKAVQVELAERLQDGRSVIATGALSVVPSSLGVVTYGTIIGRVDARFSLYFNTAGLISLIEQELLPYAGASVPPPPTIQTPAAINSDGTPQVGEQLTGVDPVFQYASITRRRWLNGTTALATTSLYTPTATGALTWSVDGLGEDGSPITSASTVTVAAASAQPPSNTALPVISGTAQQGQVLTCSTGAWTNTPSGFAYQWYRNGTLILGATNLSRTLSADDVGLTLTCRVTASNAGGSGEATSAASAVVAAAATPIPANTAAPVVSGTPTVGQTLSTTNGTWDNSPSGFTYQWRRNGVDITGANAQTYALVTADGGASVTSRVLATNASGTGSATSNAVSIAAAAVAAIVPANWDFVMGLDSRTADALSGSLAGGGYLASTAMYGPAAYLQQETGGRMRLAAKPNFGIGNSISTYSAAIPRKNALGTVVDSTPKTWARGTDSANKGADYVAATGAGIFVMLHGGADQPSDMASGLSFANLRTYLNNLPAGVLKIVFSEQPFGVNSKGQTLGASAQVFKDLSDQIKTLSFDSGHPNARSDVIVVDTWARIFDPANSAPASGVYRNKQGYYRDDRHYTPWGARDVAALVHQRLVSVYGSAYTGMASRASLPVTNGASIAADTIGVHPGFVHTNPCFTIAGNGQLTANQFWLTGPAAADIPTGWQFGASTSNGAALGGAITVAVDRTRTGADGYPEPQITFGGTLRGFTGVASQSGNTLTVESGTGTIVVGMVIQINGAAVTVVTALGTGTGGPGTYTVNTTATLASQAFLGGTSITYALFQLAQAAGQLSISDKLRAVGRVSVAAGSVGLQSAHLRLLVQDATIGKTQSALEMQGSIGGPGARNGNLMNNDGFDAANPAGDVIVSRLLDLQDPDMSTANGGPGVVASISSCAVSLDIALTNYTGADLPISAVVRVSRLGAWRAAA